MDQEKCLKPVQHSYHCISYHCITLSISEIISVSLTNIHYELR